MLKLKLQNFGHLMRRADSLEKTLMLGGIGAGGGGDTRGWDGWMASSTRWTWIWISSGSWWWTGKPGVLQCTGSQTVGHDWAVEQQHLYLVGGENSERKWQYLRKHLQAKATCLPVGILGKESYRKMGAHCAWQRSCLLSSKMKHSLETIPSSQVTRHQGSLAKEARPCLVAFQRYMSSRVFKSEPNWGERARFRNATLTQN